MQAASEVQRNLRSVASPARVAQGDIDAFFAAGYASVDETQVCKFKKGWVCVTSCYVPSTHPYGHKAESQRQLCNMSRK